MPHPAAPLRAFATCVLLALVGVASAPACAQTVPPPAPVTPAPLPQPLPSVTPSPAPTAAPAPVATTTPSPSPSPSPTAYPTANPYAYVVAAAPPATPPGDGPQIIDVSMTDSVVHSGAAVSVRVRTSPNVVGVEARAMGRFLPIPQSAPGTFILNGSVPGGIPFFLYGRKDIVFAAATADGRQTTLTVPVTLSR